MCKEALYCRFGLCHQLFPIFQTYRRKVQHAFMQCTRLMQSAELFHSSHTLSLSWISHTLHKCLDYNQYNHFNSSQRYLDIDTFPWPPHVLSSLLPCSIARHCSSLLMPCIWSNEKPIGELADTELLDWQNHSREWRPQEPQLIFLKVQKVLCIPGNEQSSEGHLRRQRMLRKQHCGAEQSCHLVSCFPSRVYGDPLLPPG